MNASTRLTDIPELKACVDYLMYRYTDDGRPAAEMSISQMLASQPTWDADSMLRGLERLCQVASTRRMLYDVYPQGQGDKRDAKLFFLPAEHQPSDKPFVICVSGGGYSCVCSAVESFPVGARLNALGYNCGAADGVFGAKTLAAVKNFQAAKSLKADGIIGAQTWAKLMNVDISQSGQNSDFIDPSTGATYKTLKRGDSGYAVTHLQNLLYQLNMFDIGDIDGKFGAKTETAVKQFQKEAGLKQDGKVGNNTFSAIYHKLGLD